MLRLTVLGTGAALPTSSRDTCSLLVSTGASATLVDCPGSIVSKLARIDVPLADLGHLILTHDHVDHIYGVPHLLHAMAVQGDCGGLTVSAPESTLRTVQAMVALHGLDGPRYPVLKLRVVPLEHDWVVAERDQVSIRSTPVIHGRDTIGLRFDCAGASAAYSSDTLACEGFARLARGVDVLLHDCGGLETELRDEPVRHHASARDAGSIAARAGAGALYLMHLGTDDIDRLALLEAEASLAFGRPARAADDGQILAPGVRRH